MVGSNILEMCSVWHDNWRNQSIPHTEHWLNINEHIIIFKHLSLPVSPTSSPQCAFQYRGVLVVSHCKCHTEGSKWDAWHGLPAASTIWCCWCCLASSIWLGIGECHSISYPLECIVVTAAEHDYLPCCHRASGHKQHFWSNGTAEQCFLPSAHCHSWS